MRQPTSEAYGELQEAFEHFNQALFEGALPFCLITLQRKRRTFGYFSHSRFVGRKGGELVDEIAMNPSYFAVRPIREALSTLVHEMVHQWQFHHGKPGRRGYHNKEWADAMEAIGLMPSNTGEPGGRRVGEQMTHYIVDGGRFDRACDELLTREFSLSWLDRFPPERPTAGLEPGGTIIIEGGLVELPPEEPIDRSNRVKYRCPVCASQVWGKPGLKIHCGGDECEGANFEAMTGSR